MNESDADALAHMIVINAIVLPSHMIINNAKFVLREKKKKEHIFAVHIWRTENRATPFIIVCCVCVCVYFLSNEKTKIFSSDTMA